MAEQGEKNTSGKRSVVRKLLVVGGVLAVTVLLTVLVLTAPNQVRSVSVPYLALMQVDNSHTPDAEGTNGAANPRTPDDAAAPQPRDRRTNSTSPPDEATDSAGQTVTRSENRDHSVPLNGSRPLSAEEVIRTAHLIQNVESLSPELQDEAREWNSEVDSVTSSLLTLLRTPNTMPYSEASNQLNGLTGKMWELYIRHAEHFPKESISMEWGKIHGMACYQIALDRKLWREAAMACMPLEVYSPESEKPMWRDRMVYCYRQDGFRGRGILMLLSAADAAESVKEFIHPKPTPTPGLP